MARFHNHMISENVQVFWAALQRGQFITDAAEAAGTYRKQGTRWVMTNGGVRPRRGRDLKGRCLTFGLRFRRHGVVYGSCGAAVLPTGRCTSSVSEEQRQERVHEILCGPLTERGEKLPLGLVA